VGPTFGRADSTVPTPFVLFPAAHGYRRRRYEGGGLRVTYDHPVSNEWGARAREQAQLRAILNEATVRAR
jgi:hypothetical protein